MCRDSSLSTVTGLRDENPSNRGSISGRCKVFDSTPNFQHPPPPLRPTQSSIQWTRGVLSGRVQLLLHQTDPLSDRSSQEIITSTNSRTIFLPTWETRPTMELINIKILILTGKKIFEIYTDTLL